ncbi:MAG: hypothetical protein EPO09_14840 [Aquabacterium sp.]|uniref:hypothetical protein n=1 Tax=Aquabacterium sp. TaxID=1872578 RepID=UPI00120B8927|nr:hypothetical protein [Aquabacterium sp.]TAK92747.1 MAG: hypothetical protein EPO09_14840 [Aquabacterium sp.]
MRAIITESWRDGIKLDGRSASMTSDRSTVGRLRILAKGFERQATFSTIRDGRETLLLPPLWRVEVISLDEWYLTLSGLQRTRERGPLQYQEWRCEILDKQKQW